MIAVWGGLLAAGLLCMTSPWLWPRRADAVSSERRGALTRLLEDAGLASLGPRVVVVGSTVCGALLAAAAWLAVGVPALGVIAGVAGASAPTLWLRRRRLGTVRARRALWPDVCDHLVASVRAGLSLPDAISALSGSAPPPIRPAFVAFAREISRTGHFDSAVDRLKTVLADPIADRILETLRMARSVGGTEVSTVLRGLSSGVRAETALRGEVEARQSWIRGAAILGVVAPWIVLALLALRPEGARAYTSPEGILVVVGGAVVSLVAYRLMVRVGRLPEQQRWFA